MIAGAVIMFACVAPMWIMAYFLLQGRGAWMISGYNMMSNKEKALYDERALCRYSGKMLIAIGLGMALMGAGMLNYELNTALFYSGLVITLVVSLGGCIPMFTMRRFLRRDVTAGELVTARAGRKTSKAMIVVTVAIMVLTLGGVGAMFVAGEREAVVTVGADSVHISGMYGTTISLTNIAEVTLIEDTARGIGLGTRRNGYARGNTLKGHFRAGLVFADASSAPTIVISRTHAPDVIISHRDSEATRALYRELAGALQ